VRSRRPRRPDAPPNTRFSFTSTGHGNRTALAGSIGVAMIFVAIAAWASSLLRSVRARTNAFAGLVGVLCFAGTAVVNALAEDQVNAAAAQRRVLSDIQRAVATWPSGSSVILHGYCPYSGTAIVFERSDFEGALRVIYRDDTLIGDVGSRLELEDSALVTTAVGQRGIYPYEPRLFVFDGHRQRAVQLSRRAAAVDHFGGRRADWPATCPPGAPDIAVPLFPLDRLHLRLTRAVIP
jgi:hypothetical protein